MPVRIYKPARTAMQSGRGGTDTWVLEPDATSDVTVDPLMGWSGSTDTDKQVRLVFPTREDAVRYAEQAGLAYTVAEPTTHKIKPRAYADNFKYGRIGSWTH